MAYCAGGGPVRASSSASRSGALGCADPLEYFQCLPQENLGLGGVADGAPLSLSASASPPRLPRSR